MSSRVPTRVEELKRSHLARTEQGQGALDSEIDLARSVCELQTYYDWKSNEKDGSTDKNWNKISLIKLITGRS